MIDATAPKGPMPLDETERAETPMPLAGSPAKAAKPEPDMASLMMELARIRREIEGQSEPKKAVGFKGWLLVAAIAAALVWWMLGGPCVPPRGLP